MSEFVTVREAAKVIGVHPLTIRRLAREGRIRSLQFGKGRAVRIDLTSLLNVGREPEPAKQERGGDAA